MVAALYRTSFVHVHNIFVLLNIDTYSNLLGSSRSSSSNQKVGAEKKTILQLHNICTYLLVAAVSERVKKNVQNDVVLGSISSRFCLNRVCDKRTCMVWRCGRLLDLCVLFASLRIYYLIFCSFFILFTARIFAFFFFFWFTSRVFLLYVCFNKNGARLCLVHSRLCFVLAIIHVMSVMCMRLIVIYTAHTFLHDGDLSFFVPQAFLQGFCKEPYQNKFNTTNHRLL